MSGSNSTPTGAVCEESEGIRAMTAKAAGQMVADALAFQQDVAMRNCDEAAVSATTMRVAMVRCISLNNLWMQHRAEHGCG